jgi:regulator of sirC expression with transglutaminase-like and TPR domain
VDHGVHGEFREAVADLTKTLELAPEHPGARRSRAAAYAALGEHAIAADDLTELIRRYPNEASLYVERSHSHRALGRSGDAEADERRARELMAGGRK